MDIFFYLPWRYIYLFANAARTHQPHPTHSEFYEEDCRHFGVKMRIFRGQDRYVGHVIRPGQLKVSNHTDDAIHNLKIPTTQRKIRSFICLCSVFRQFVPNLTRNLSLLTAKLRKSDAKYVGQLNEKKITVLWTLRRTYLSPKYWRYPWWKVYIRSTRMHVIAK